jgi:ABC-type multidrug transport system ATPase subunit
LTFQTAGASGLRFDKVDKRYGGIYALRQVSLEIAAGECVALAGRNGSGKTTLLRVASKLVRPSAGTFHFTGAAENQRASTGYVAHATMVYDELTAAENLFLFARLQNVDRPASRVDSLLNETGLTDRRDSLVRTFSRGMRQRVAIARALLQEPVILFLDEPATGLDVTGVIWLANTLRSLHRAGCTILMSLHDESEISSLATRAVRLEAGCVAADTRAGAALNSIFLQPNS